MEKVDIFTAFCWDCPECGVENFIRGRTRCLEELNEDEIKKGMDLDDWQDIPPGNLVAVPTDVTCDVCGKTYETSASNQF